MALDRIDTLAVKLELELGDSCAGAAGDLPSSPNVGILVRVSQPALVVTLSPGIRNVHTSTEVVALVDTGVERSGVSIAD